MTLCMSGYSNACESATFRDLSAGPVQSHICTELAAIDLEIIGQAHETGVAAGVPGLFNNIFEHAYCGWICPSFFSVTRVQLLPVYGRPPGSYAANHVSLRTMCSSANPHIRSHCGIIRRCLGCGSTYLRSNLCGINLTVNLECSI